MKVRAIILAAGKGTRMKSATPKVLHEICGRPMLWYVLETLAAAGIREPLVVIGPDLEPFAGSIRAPTVVQHEQLGTGHAVRVALDELGADSAGRILIANGDMPLVGETVFARALEALVSDGAAAALVTVRMPLPSSFGRVVRRDGEVERIVEVRDASTDELRIDEMNAGIYAFEETALREVISQLNNANAQGEYYVTDAVERTVRGGKRVVPVAAGDHHSMLGINDRVELAQARAAMNARLCERYMREGATIVDPQTTYLEPELRIGRDTVIYPNSTIGRLSAIGRSCTIGPNVRLSNARLGDRVTIRESVVVDTQIADETIVGPFAHLRGETELGAGVRIGNFVEIKHAKLSRGAKASHLSYVGDAEVGEETNIGAGTITCNFDGVRKNVTKIGRNVSIGSNTSLVAPVTIGDDALTGASSVVTKDVAPGQRVAGNPARPLPKKEQ